MPERFHKHILLLLATIVCAPAAFSQGLGFSGNDFSIDRRTSYDVFGDRRHVAHRSFTVSFDLSLVASDDLGYIVRVKDAASGSDEGAIFNLFFDGQGGDLAFRFNEEGRSNLAALDVPRDEWHRGEWRHAALTFDVEHGRIVLELAGRRLEANAAGLPRRFSPAVVFGRSDHMIDVADFAIRGVEVAVDDRRWAFDLGEHDGGEVHDRRGRAVGHVSNPRWLINNSMRWQAMGMFTSSGVAGAVYDPATESVHYLNRDEITTLDLLSGTHATRRFAEPCPVEMALGTCFVAAGRIYVYEVYKGPEYAGPTVASLDPATLAWRVESHDQLPTQLHHHASWLDPQSGRYTIFGGFGDMRYSGEAHSFDLATGRWQTLPAPSAESLCPRYFSSAGRSEADGSVYIFGGMGNESGQQIVGRKYLYDLHRVNPADGRAELLWSIPWTEHDMVPVRGMAIEDDHIYTLLYPEHLTESHLTLHRFSIADGTVERMENSIPIGSDKITTNANLHYDPRRGMFYALVQEFEDDIASTLTVYRLAAPPVMAGAEPDAAAGRRGNILVICGMAVLIAVAALVMRRLRLRPQHTRGADAEGADDTAGGEGRDVRRLPAKPAPNSVRMMGDFRVIDRNGVNITYMFSHQLRRAFCYILWYSPSGGVTARALSNAMWPDKPEQAAKNTRNVTISHLRKVLGEMDGVELVTERGMLRIVTPDSFGCDALHLAELLGAGQEAERRDEFVGIATSGKFMGFADGDPMLDSCKKEMEQMLEPALTAEMKRSASGGRWRTVIDLAEALFHIDPLNDEALGFMVDAMNRLNMSDEARRRQKLFTLEQKRVFGG